MKNCDAVINEIQVYCGGVCDFYSRGHSELPIEARIACNVLKIIERSK